MNMHILWSIYEYILYHEVLSFTYKTDAVETAEN